MSDLEHAILLLTKEIKGLRADLRNSTVKKLMEEENRTRLEKSKDMIRKLNHRRNGGLNGKKTKLRNMQ